jgi:F-type H+-transporting ATPase subunit epsilon
MTNGMNLIDFEITTPERAVFREKIRQVSIPTLEGEITVLPDHVPLVAPVLAGELRLLDEKGGEILMAVSGGFVTIHPDGHVVVLADTAERAEELDLAAIEEAKKRAEKVLSEKLDEERFADATAHLARELARLKVARKRRSKG